MFKVCLKLFKTCLNALRCNMDSKKYISTLQIDKQKIIPLDAKNDSSERFKSTLNVKLQQTTKSSGNMRLISTL